jgi:hypothetical protein
LGCKVDRNFLVAFQRAAGTGGALERSEQPGRQMATDDDLTALMPQPPPARPARREAAIELALRRFDGSGRQADLPTQRPARRFEGLGRPQVVALVSVALVVLVSVPVWWAEQDRLAPRAPQVSERSAEAIPEATAGSALHDSPPTEASLSRSPSPEAGASEDVQDAAPSEVPPPPAVALPAPPPPAEIGALPRSREEPALTRNAAPGPPAAAAKPAASRAAVEDSIMVTGSRAVRQDFESASPVATIDQGFLAQADWNACTLLDARRDIGACRGFADPAAAGARGQAGARLADGLVRAWEGDLDRAIDSFGGAIRAAPDLSIAYLNRGLAYQAKGDLPRALADLDRAVARDSGSARAYYHRSRIHRARGDEARAEADARRAIELDPR